jgi:tRNA(Ile)-lysidine synthetase-like protein
VHHLAQRVIAHIRRHELLRAGDRMGIAVSGGIDSVALLRLLMELRHELGVVLAVVHFNHHLRGAESDLDQAFVAHLAREHDLEFYVDGDDVAERAAEERISLETAARELRYGFFRHLLGEDGESPGPPGAEAQIHHSRQSRSAGSAAPPKRDPQGLKPDSLQMLDGAAGSRALSRLASEGMNATKAESARMNPARLNKIATGHTLDDQAETVLMRIIRGSGLRGLGGIYPQILVEGLTENDDEEVCGEIVRPLLSIRRRELEQYLREIGQNWREDSSNADEHFTRNRLRKLVLPLLEKEFNPAVAENLAELAEIARGEEDYWENEIAGWLGTTVQWSEPDWARPASAQKNLVQIALPGAACAQTTIKIPTSRAKDAREMGHPGIHDQRVDDQRIDDPQISGLQSRIDSVPWKVVNASVSRMWFLGEPIAAQRRLVKAIGEHAGIPLEFKHVEEVLRFAEQDASSGKELSLPLGWTLLREPEKLRFLTPDLRDSSTPSDYERDYEYELSLPGEIRVVEAGSTIELRRIPAAAVAGYNSEQLLDAQSLPGPFRVRNWRPGDRFWPAHTKSPKKIKELLQELQVVLPDRKLWPVLLSEGEIVWVRGFPVPAKVRAKPGREAILVVDGPLAR